MKSVLYVWSVAAAIVASYCTTATAQYRPCGGCSDPCASDAPAIIRSSSCGGAVGCGQGYVVSPGVAYDQTHYAILQDNFSGIAPVTSAVPSSEPLCEPMTNFRLVMKPTYVTESRPVSVQEIRPETRYRTKTVYKTVPITEEKFRTTMTNVPKTETKTINYTVLVPVKSEKSVEVTETVPKWSEEPEEYTVRVPSLIDVPEEYTVKVPKLRDETFTYTVNVPQPVTEQRTRTVINAIPVTKQRTIQISVPKTEMKTVTRDYGHWEEQIVEVPAAPVAMNVVHVPVSCGCGVCNSCCDTIVSTGCGSRGGCGSSIGYGAPGVAVDCGASALTTTTRRVWVPNVTTETIEVTIPSQESQIVNYTVYEQQSTEVPYECTTIVYVPETRTGIKQVVDYVDEPRTRTRKIVQYNDETRTRMRKTLTFDTVTKTETVPYVTYNTEERTKEISYTYNVPEYSLEPYQTTRYERVAEEVAEQYTVNVPVTVTKEESVQVCKMIPTLVEETINPCLSGSSTGIISGAIDVGPSVMQDSSCVTPMIYAPVLSAPVMNNGCGGCGATVSASPCHGC